TPFVIVPRYVWRLPWHYTDIRIASSWQSELCTSYSYVAKGDWGSAELEMVGTEDEMGTLDGFADEEETRIILTHPLTGYYNRMDGRPGTYNIWHDKLQMKRAIVSRSRFEVFERLNLIQADSKPHSALIQRTTEFVIYLPPQLDNSR